MTFRDWLKKNGLSIASIDKYEGAISGAITEWAIQANLIDEPILSIKDYSQFKRVAESIQELPVFKERNERGNNMYSSALRWYLDFLENRSNHNIEDDIDEIISDGDISDTEKSSLIKSRIGQGTFRQKQIEYWKGCAVTGYKDVNLLVASHIKPWRKSDNKERLDLYNGLLLLPNIDSAFDKGFITFMSSGKIMLSSSMENPSLLGITPKLSIKPSKQHQPFLEYHRNEVFRD